MILNDESERVWKKEVIDQFKVLPCNGMEDLGKNTKYLIKTVGVRAAIRAGYLLKPRQKF
jgi:hypothetical protein